jgi:hypothetical protein
VELRTPEEYTEPLDAAHLRLICDGILRTLWRHGCSDEEIRAVALPRTVTAPDEQLSAARRTGERTAREVAHDQEMLALRAAAEQIPDVWP